MADSDGDEVRCRWGYDEFEVGDIYSAKGDLRSNPCELTYNATMIGYEGVALVIEDFDTNGALLSSIPLQFLIQIVDAPTDNNESTVSPSLPPSCHIPPVYLGDWQRDACVGVNSNSTVELRIVVEISCQNTSTKIQDILTISPQGMTKSYITQDPMSSNTYIMHLQWQPRPDQYGIHQVCVTPADSEGQIGSQTCFNLQVDVKSPTFIRDSIVPTGIVAQNQNIWSISTDVDIVRPTHRNVYARFIKRVPFNSSRDTEIIRVNSDNAHYDRRRITFYTDGTIWEKGQNYYIILDGGIAEINQACGVQSAPVIDSNFWTFAIEMTHTTESTQITTSKSPIGTLSSIVESNTSEEFSSSTVKVISTEATISTSPTNTPDPFASASLTTKRRTTATSTTKTTTTTTTTTTTASTSPNVICPRWLQFGLIINVTTNASHPEFTFCFHVNQSSSDVTVAANTWVPCANWKVSGAGDPLMDLYVIGNNLKMLAQNDDGNSIPHLNCYASVLSYRLDRGNYRVVIRHHKCLYGYFEVRLSAETTNPFI
ncbi:unnamed protein product [Rotaria sp. Silwood2]|nr:unnamed protein product [Rotaria sp. Silwood2]